MNQKLSVVIAGGGVGGLALAIKLKRLGVSSIVIEKQISKAHSASAPQLKGEYFQPQGVAILDELGLLPEMEKCAQRIQNVSHRFWDPVRRKPKTLKARYNRSRKWSYGLVIFHEEILEIMRKEYRKLGGELNEGLRVTDLQNLNDHFLVSLSDGRTIRADIFVGADGRFSVSRKMAGLKVTKFPCDRFMAAALVKNLKIPKGEFYTEEITDGVVYAFAYPDGIARVYACFEKEQLNEALKDKDSFLIKKIQSTSIRGRKTAKLCDRVMMMPTDDMMLDVANFGNGIWFGDAAGTLDPLGGHGMSVALSQAMRIATAIRVGLQVPHRISTLLKQAAESNRAEYLQARFLSLWIGYLFMNTNLINRLAKRHVLTRYMSDRRLRTYCADFFGGVSDRPVSLLDIPYLLGVVPTSMMSAVRVAGVDHLLIELQNQALVTPLRLSQRNFAKKALELTKNYLRIPRLARSF